MNAATGVSPIEGVLAALADPTRRQLLNRLAMRGEATATSLSSEMSVTRQAVVQHLALLDAAGLVEGRRAGRERRFVVCPQRLTETARWMDRLAAQWDARLAAIKRIAEQAIPPGSAPQEIERQRGGEGADASEGQPT